MKTEFHCTAIGHWLDAVEYGCRFGRGARPYPLPLWDFLLADSPRDSVWVHGYRIGCYIRDAWLRLH